jgi:hypothetical protein
MPAPPNPLLESEFSVSTGPGDKKGVYRIIWFISPPYVARARQMPSLRGGRIAKGDL